MKNLKSLLLFTFTFVLLINFYSCDDKDPIRGCTNPVAENYNPDAEESDGSCVVNGCTDMESTNFNPEATQDDGSCAYRKDLFIGTYVGTSECDNPLLNDLILGSEIIFKIIEIPGENDKVTVEVEFSLDDLDQMPEATIDENNVLRFEQEQKETEIDILGTGMPVIVDITTTGEFTLDEATMDKLTGVITIELKDSALGATLLMSSCDAEADRQ